MNYVMSLDGDDENVGSVLLPWKTLAHATSQLSPGDTLMIRGGVYPSEEFNVSQPGQADALFTVRSFEGEPVLFSHPEQRKRVRYYSAHYWLWQGIDFHNMGFLFGDAGNVTEGLTLQGNIFTGKYKPVEARYCRDCIIDGNTFGAIQSPAAGQDVNAISVDDAENITIINNYGIDCSSDVVQLGSKSSDINNVTIAGNRFYVQYNPDGGLTNPDIAYARTGENAIDVMAVGGGINFFSIVIYGYRPTLPGQNASGASGAGIVLHNGSTNVEVHKNIIFSCAQGIAANRVDSIHIHDNVIFNILDEDGKGFGVRVSNSNAIEVEFNIIDAPITLRSYKNDPDSNTYRNNVELGGVRNIDDPDSWDFASVSPPQLSLDSCPEPPDLTALTRQIDAVNVALGAVNMSFAGVKSEVDKVR